MLEWLFGMAELRTSVRHLETAIIFHKIQFNFLIRNTKINPVKNHIHIDIRLFSLHVDFVFCWSYYDHFAFILKIVCVWSFVFEFESYFQIFFQLTEWSISSKHRYIKWKFCYRLSQKKCDLSLNAHSTPWKWITDKSRVSFGKFRKFPVSWAWQLRSHLYLYQ